MVAIDDDESLLKTLSFFLCGKRKIMPFTNPNEALGFLTSYVRQPQITTAANEGIITLKSYLQTPDRFNEIVVVMSDYNMPVENGVSFFKHLSINTAYPFKRVLFTGMTQTSIAAIEPSVHIDVKMEKVKMLGNADLLPNTLQHLEADFFADYPTVLDIPLLNNPHYVKLVQKIITDNNIVDGYLLDTKGNYLFMNPDGQPIKLSMLDSLTEPAIFGKTYVLEAVSDIQLPEKICSFKDYLYS